MSFVAERAVRTRAFLLPMPAARAFPLTGLGESGNAYIRAMDDASYARYIDSRAQAIAKL